MARIIAVIFLSLLVAIRPVAAQSILRDAETEAFFKEITDPIVAASTLRKGDVDVVLIADDSINAFVAGGQRIYLHSGLIEAADNANQVQGVIAHELGHIEGGHVIRAGEGASAATNISIASLLLGAAAMAAGAGDAAMGIMMAGQQAALGKFLAYTRVQESVADASGARYLSGAGITGKGSIEFFKKLQNYEYRLGIPQDDDQTYGRTHPLSGDRIQYLRDTYQADPAWDVPLNEKWEAEFKRVKAKLMGYIQPGQALRDYPESDMSVPALYARAYAWHRSGYPDRALDAARTLVERDPQDPYFLELYGQILMESGRPDEAIGPLREAVRLTGNQPLIAGLYGHALIATENSENFAEAERVLKAAVARDNDNPFAWYQLGIVYAERGDMARAALASAERYLMQGQPRVALVNSEKAMAGLDRGTPDWIRAQDIKLIAQERMDKDNKKRSRG